MPKTSAVRRDERVALERRSARVLKQAFVKSGMGLRELARLVGVHHPELSTFFGGKRKTGLGLPKLLRLAEVLGVSEEQALGLRPRALPVPVLSRLPAGPYRLDAAERTGQSIDVPTYLLQDTADVFAFRVVGDSMKDAGILEGDVAVVKAIPGAADHANQGELVVATLRDEGMTLKRFEFRESERWLVPANPRYQPIRLREGEGLIQGVLVCLLRGYGVSLTR
jgi:SOS-response transcriptional repressor LexA